ncbi:MAG: MFS transporter [Myxococcota bacterium]|nr:MFS transporter [Myxococcota bacterium]
MPPEEAGRDARRGRGTIGSPRAVLALLTALNLLNYLDRYVLSAVLPRLQEDLHLSHFFGGSLATVFLIGYFATSPVFGNLADRVGDGGRKRLIAVGVAVWSIATVASGLVRSAASLVVARALVGVGEASYATIAPTLIDDVTEAKRKGRAMAVFSAALPVGSAMGYVVGGAVEHSHGWRAAFFVAGGPGLLLALLCLLIAEPFRRSSAVPDALGAARTLWRVVGYRRAVLGYSAYTFAIGGFAYWAPTYLHVRYGLEPGVASVRFGLVTVAGGLIGTLIGGWLGDALGTARGKRLPGQGGDATGTDAAIARGNLVVCALAAGLGAPLALAAIAAPSAGAFFTLLFPCEIALFLLSGPVNVVLLRSVPGALRASAMALAIFAIHLLGDLWSPPLLGFVADHAPIALAMSMAPLAFAVAAIVWWRASARLT